MAYYRMSKVVKMRREAFGCERCAFDADGPAGMTVYRLEEGKNKASEHTYRSLTRAMGQEESTRQGILKTKDVKVLHQVGKITENILSGDIENAKSLVQELKKNLDMQVPRNQHYVKYLEYKLRYLEGEISDAKYETAMLRVLNYGEEHKQIIDKLWPFQERELQIVISLTEIIRKQGKQDQQKLLLEHVKKILESGYLDTEYGSAYLAWTRWRTGDVLGSMGEHRLAIEWDEDSIRFCEEKCEYRYLAELYYDIFWNYMEIEKTETLTAEEQIRRKECLLKAYYVNKAWFLPKPLYERRVREYYPEELA